MRGAHRQELVAEEGEVLVHQIRAAGACKVQSTKQLHPSIGKDLRHLRSLKWLSSLRWRLYYAGEESFGDLFLPICKSLDVGLCPRDVVGLGV